MVKHQKPKNNTITKLYKILDFNSKKDLRPENEKYLVSLSQRLREISGERIIYRRITSKEILEDKIDPLKPKIVIHSRKVEKKIEFPEVKIEEEKKIDYSDEEIFEIEKVKVKGPEFIEVKPKVIAKEEISEKREIKKEEDIPEWIPVETEKKEESLEELPELEPIPQVEDKKFYIEPITKVQVKKEKKRDLETKIEFCPECGTKLDIVSDFCPECGTEIKIESTTSFIPVKKVEEEYTPSEWEAIEIEKPIVEKKPIIEKEVKIAAFKDIKSIDEKIAVLLYDNGITTIDTLKGVSLKDLTKIKGIKKKIAKEIKKEVEKKISESLKEEPIKIEESAKDEFTEEQLPRDVKLEDETEEWPSPKELTSKTSIWEPTEEEMKDKEEIPIFEEFITDKEKEKPVIDRDSKIEVFKEIKCIDNKTAVLLYDNGYTNTDALIKAPLKDLTKIKGIKRKTAKNIKKELEETKTKPILIPVGEVKKKTKTKDILKIEKKLDTTKKELEKISKELNIKEENMQQLQKEIEVKTKDLETRNNELNKKDKEIEKIKTELQTKTEESNKKQQTITTLTEKQKELENREKEIKIKIFKDIKSIDDETAILLYDKGITNIDILTKTSQKDLTKIKGIKRKTAKNIKKELEQKSDKESHEVTETEKKERPTEYYSDEKEITRDEAGEIDKKIVEEFSISVMGDDVFKDINSINIKISNLLKENGIDSLDALRKATIKDLTKIQGIKRKVAKQIKKEISSLPEESANIISKSSIEQEEPFIEKEEDEWESYDEDKISYSKMREIKGFRHGDYSLYKKEIETKSGKKRTVRFFSKAEPDEGEPIELPKGYKVKLNKKTGLPYLKKKK